MMKDELVERMEAAGVDDPYMLPDLYGDDESWKAVPRFEGLYEFSNCGRLRSLDRTDQLGRFWRGRIIRPIYEQGGERYRLHRNGKRHSMWATELMDLTHPNPVLAAFEKLKKRIDAVVGR